MHTLNESRKGKIDILSILVHLLLHHCRFLRVGPEFLCPTGKVSSRSLIAFDKYLFELLRYKTIRPHFSQWSALL